jgi:hypothetical protein
MMSTCACTEARGHLLEVSSCTRGQTQVGRLCTAHAFYLLSHRTTPLNHSQKSSLILWTKSSPWKAIPERSLPLLPAPHCLLQHPCLSFCSHIPSAIFLRVCFPMRPMPCQSMFGLIFLDEVQQIISHQAASESQSKDAGLMVKCSCWFEEVPMRLVTPDSGCVPVAISKDN